MLKAIIQDLKEDINTIKKIMQKSKEGKPILTDEFKTNFKKAFNIGNIFKEYSIFFFILILAVITGVLISSQFYESKCNQFIINNILEGDNYGKMAFDYAKSQRNFLNNPNYTTFNEFKEDANALSNSYCQECKCD